ncbi:MAG: hypothetical protein ACRC54_04955 [Fusobacteriaceae bacterium]
MSVNIYVYEKNKPVVGLPAPSMEEFMEDPQKFYPEIKKGFIASTERIEDYIIEGEIVREKKREEKIIIDGKTELLLPGEYVKDGEVIVVPKTDSLLKPIWNSETNTWEESATIEDIDNKVSDLISEYVLMAEKKEKYEKYGFETLEFEEQMAQNIMIRTELLSLKETLI